ncbi:MAG: FAD:protein FMN transferase [Solirubrobacterales bacterium]|nr:FAD:protein FMN transferase [Solirubrobacterales bacterium]
MSHRHGSSSFPALGSTAFVAVTDERRLELAIREVRGEVDDLDRSCSRFRDDSELSRLNAAAPRSVSVSHLLLEAVQIALRAAILTDGDVDPTIGLALISLGYGSDFGSIGNPGPARFAAVRGWKSVEVDASRSTIRLPRGVALDLGATAKALGADRAARRAHAATGCGVLVGLGGDFAMAGAPPPSGWRIRVTDDHSAGVSSPGQWIAVRSGGLATSSTTARRWSAAGEPMHHLVDPATSRPVEAIWRTATVAAACCVDANIASTAAIIKRERTAEWLRARGLPSRLVSVAGTARHLGGWPADGEELPIAQEQPPDKRPTRASASLVAPA